MEEGERGLKGVVGGGEFLVVDNLMGIIRDSYKYE
jgi:hypothetical protein